MTTCTFLRSCAEPELAFADPAALADHLRGLADGADVALARVVLTTPDHNRGRVGVSCRIAASGEGLGYAILGERPAGVQLELLARAIGDQARVAA